nr:MAG TPA: hypothetical protein [Caudoviricetes sp.]
MRLFGKIKKLLSVIWHNIIILQIWGNLIFSILRHCRKGCH